MTPTVRLSVLTRSVCPLRKWRINDYTPPASLNDHMERERDTKWGSPAGKKEGNSNKKMAYVRSLPRPWFENRNLAKREESRGKRKTNSRTQQPQGFKVPRRGAALLAPYPLLQPLPSWSASRSRGSMYACCSRISEASALQTVKYDWSAEIMAARQKDVYIPALEAEFHSIRQMF